jgi:nicotinamide-nucleotide amidase
MKAEIISIGNELLAGHTVNTNATFISQQLFSIGLSVRWVTTIRDEEIEIKTALKAAETRANVVLITGGLGPTPDDITKKVAAAYFNRPFQQNERVLDDIKQFVEAKNIPLKKHNTLQAFIPKCDFWVRNSIGTAPGLGFIKNKAYFIFMPGVPSEMKQMLNGFILNDLKNRLRLPNVNTAIFRTTGIPESRLYEKLKPILDRNDTIEVSFLPRFIGVDLRFKLISQNDENRILFTKFLNKIENECKPYIFAKTEEELETTLNQLLWKNNLTISIAESFTGGLISDLITNVPGSSQSFMGGIVAYSNKSKERFLNVNPQTLAEHGAVSAETALEMAKGVKEKFNAECSLSTTGIAGPGGATAEKKVGLCYIAACFNEKIAAKEFHFGLSREANKKRGAAAAMELLRRLILNR